MNKLALFAGLTLAASAAYAQTYTTPIQRSSSALTIADTGTLTLNGEVDTSGMAFNSTLTSNPLEQVHYATMTTATLNAAPVVIASATAKKIHLTDAMVSASGTVATATAIALKCSGGTSILSWPAALLTDDAVVGAYASTTVTRSLPLINGCPAGEAVVASPTGTVATTSRFTVKVTYTVQ